MRRSIFATVLCSGCLSQMFTGAGTARDAGTCSKVLQIPTGTTDPIALVRVELASEKVAGWNEIDAIGVAP
jgi:hypothetical protein